jgi:integrase/recombinase XerD
MAREGGMTMSLNMSDNVEAYLGERKTLGFRDGGPNDVMLRSFARFADNSGHEGSLTIDLVIDWAKGQARIAEPRSWARRLDILRPFAGYLMRGDPATRFPPTPIFGKSHRRLTPHIYTEQEIAALLTKAGQLAPADGLRPATYETLFGIIAATGLRISEAINLRCADVDLDASCLTVRMTKYCKSRHVPLHISVTDALIDYLRRRDRFLGRHPDDPFFVADPRRKLKKRNVHWTFQRIRDDLGLIPRGNHPAVRIHDLRHSFICRRVQQWLAQGADIDNAIAALSTYVGHAKVSDTYWYLTGIPDLMAVAGARFEDFALEGVHHV